MKYHFRFYREQNGFWGECIEMKGCMSQGRTLEDLKENLGEALNLYLDEPEDSKTMFPLPKASLKGKNILEIEVDPRIALAFLVRTERLKKKWTQAATAKHLGMPLYSYQRLESSKTANPEWKTLVKLRKVFPGLNLNQAT